MGTITEDKTLEKTTVPANSFKVTDAELQSGPERLEVKGAPTMYSFLSAVVPLKEYTTRKSLASGTYKKVAPGTREGSAPGFDGTSKFDKFTPAERQARNDAYWKEWTQGRAWYEQENGDHFIWFHGNEWVLGAPKDVSDNSLYTSPVTNRENMIFPPKSGWELKANKWSLEQYRPKEFQEKTEILKKMEVCVL